ncbi:PIN domain-containing protein [Prosthecobacter sp.]|uniref:PIN domain-containing protein n=1 Tax=Prosthecobacter sp. TaxID=1965333 RepID=UPI002ABB9163|nr:PIN domain-containing protein [Prosthecobacter sp.]MDZ4404980.1 PIN domain-containing protein [Prosthecobacter sp.]
MVDSNIWMNREYEAFFGALRLAALEAKRQVVLPGVQFDEICNIKNRTGYEDQKNKRARLAINRIEKAQKEKWLRIDSISTNADKRAYADPIVAKIVRDALKLDQQVYFFSDDIELRIRIREQNHDIEPTRLGIYEIQEILAGCEAIIEADKLIQSQA